jgi:hypothetical protein
MASNKPMIFSLEVNAFRRSAKLSRTSSKGAWTMMLAFDNGRLFDTGCITHFEYQGTWYRLLFKYGTNLEVSLFDENDLEHKVRHRVLTEDK